MKTIEFMELTEAELLKAVGDQLHSFFAPKVSEYRELPREQGSSEELRYEKVEVANPRAAILPVAQVNIVANASFHILATQLAVILHQRPELSAESVYQNTFDNIKRLTARYLEVAKGEMSPQCE